MKRTVTFLGYILGVLLTIWILLPASIRAQADGPESGLAVLIPPSEQVRTTSSGEIYDPQSLTAAHVTLPMDAMVRVRNVRSGRSAVVRINNRLDSGAQSVLAVTPAVAHLIGLDPTDKMAIELEVELSRISLGEPMRPRFTLQIGLFSTKESANMFASGIENSWIKPISDAGRPQFRVYYRRFTEEEPARIAQQDLQKQGFNSFLRKIIS